VLVASYPLLAICLPYSCIPVLLISIMAQLTIFPDRLTQWHGSDGRAFATRIGRRRRHGIARFVITSSLSLPVTVKIVRLERKREQKVFACISSGEVKVGLSYRNYFILMQLQDAIDPIREMVTNFTSTT